MLETVERWNDDAHNRGRVRQVVGGICHGTVLIDPRTVEAVAVLLLGGRRERRNGCLMKLSLIALVMIVFPLQAPKKEAPPATAETQEAPTASDGLWPSPRMRDLMLSRWVDQVGRQFDLGEKETDQLRESVVKRWGEFIGDNRATLKPLINDFLEMRLGRKPPSKEQVETWAREALPMFKKTRTQFDEGKDDFTEVLNPLQQGKFAVQLLKLVVGMNLVEHRLTQLADGNIDDDALDMFWEEPGMTNADRRQRREQRRRERAEAIEQAVRAKTAATDPIDVELTAWEQYATDFIRRFNLDAGQRTTARSCLTELTERARAHGDRHRADVTRIETQIAGFTGSEEELATLKEKLTELYGPIDEMFKELEARLNQIPTAAQRAKAEQAQEEQSPPGETGGADGRPSPSR